MSQFITLTNDYFEIFIPEYLERFGFQVLEYSTIKIKEYVRFFKKETYGEKIKCAFFTNRDDFVTRIKKLDKEANPPSWAQGCFYGREIQILINNMKFKDIFYTLSHETFHLLFKRFVYEKNNWNRFVWLDEALANNFDGTTEEKINSGEFEKIIRYYSNKKNLPKMNVLDFAKGTIKTENYNGYDFFRIVGRYLIETNTKDELLNYINIKERIKRDGYTILDVALKYFKEKYGIINIGGYNEKQKNNRKR